MKYQKYVDSQKKECNGTHLNKGSGPLFTFKQSIHTLAYSPPFYSSFLMEYRISWPVLQKGSILPMKALLCIMVRNDTVMENLLSHYLWKQNKIIKLIF